MLLPGAMMIIFVARASGIAPIRAILAQMKEEGIARKATFFFGGNEVRDMYLLDEMRAFEKDLPGFTFVPTVARPAADEQWSGETGLVTEALDRHVQAASAMEGYLCGAPAMIDALIELLAAKGMPEANIFYDKYA